MSLFYIKYFFRQIGELVAKFYKCINGQYFIVKTHRCNIAEIFELGMKEKWIDETGLIFKVLDSPDGKYVSGVLKGNCKFRIGVKKIINLEEEDIITHL